MHMCECRFLHYLRIDHLNYSKHCKVNMLIPFNAIRPLSHLVKTTAGAQKQHEIQEQFLNTEEQSYEQYQTKHEYYTSITLKESLTHSLFINN